MSLRDLLIIYAIVGLACSVAIFHASPHKNTKSALAAALAVPLWPIWAPIALTSGPKSNAFLVQMGPQSTAAALNRVQNALREGMDACSGTSFEALLPKSAAARIESEVGRAAARHQELCGILAREGFSETAALARVGDLEKSGASPRAISTARLHLENVRRLGAMRDRDARALEELSDLVQALRTQLVLARYAGSSVEGVGGIVSEVWARVEGLSAAMDAQDPQENEPSAAIAQIRSQAGEESRAV